MNASKPGWGALFVSKKKEAGSKQPEYTGTATCCHCNEPMRLAGWKRVSEKGLTYLNLKLEPEGERRETTTRETDEEIPF
jgi:uncharacterized protein (DUF736 family)